MFVTSDARFEKLTRWERLGIVLFFATLVAFGGWVEMRTTFLSRRMGDLNCFLRPAWAVRTGHDIYQILDDCGWHYNYPPFLAIVLTPLADAPAGEDRAAMLPYPVSVAIWYLINVTCLALGLHLLAKALEERSGLGVVPPGCRRWWALRLWPLLACLAPVGQSLMRGQVNLIVLMCFCVGLAAMLRKQSGGAGWWLSWPICIKVFPAFLLLYPMARRDMRCLVGCAVGLLIGLVLVPMAAFGPRGTIDYYQEFYEVTLAPGLGIGSDTSRSTELTMTTSTDSQSFVATLHNAMYPDRTKRPLDASPAVRRCSYIIGGFMTLATFLVGWRRKLAGPDIVLQFGALMIVMILLCPVCHLHYFSFAVPLIMGFLAAAWQDNAAPRLGIGLGLLLGANMILNFLPHIPGLEIVRDLGLAMYCAVILWGTALVVIWLRTRISTESVISRSNPQRIAA